MADLIELTHTDRPAWSLSDERVPVFTVRRPNPEHAAWEQADRDGEDNTPEPERELVTAYTMPAKPNPGLALAYLKRARENSDLAAAWLLELAIGSDGYDALAEELANEPDPDVAQATMQSIIQSVAKRTLGGLGKA